MKYQTNRSLSVVTLSLLLAASVFADVRYITFDEPVFSGAQDPYGTAMFFYEDGFQFFTKGGGGSIIRFDPEQSSFVPNNGTIHFGATGFSLPSFHHEHGYPFDLFAIDLAWYSQFFRQWTATFQGTFVDGRTIEESFSIGSSFQTFTFGPEWTNLISVDISPGIAWDNVAVAIVPEPSTLSTYALLFCLLLGLGKRRLGSHFSGSGRRAESFE